ncbi:hypothetical protein LCGC14_3076520, partial [marine sediment metagenome]
LKNTIERSTKAHFIDGNLDQGLIREELHGWVNEATNERMSDGNIIFHYQFAIDNFTADRNIETQRVCAHETPEGNIRVFYKMSLGLRAAIWQGSRWYVEEFMRNSGGLEPIEIPEQTDDLRLVTGGFGSSSFEGSTTGGETSGTGSGESSGGTGGTGGTGSGESSGAGVNP